ncbi:putative lipoprotein (DUF799 domain) [Campylobacter hyointestinalis subsp. lawsonii CCUG 27631]|uniref:GNA1162 family protein n=1 Tax=Campylobacter hyointestinalis TaxID=198 RepID=UPI0007C8ED3E|nr:GNA1162 family protein [Campylobacter hyointestinalis]ANE34870.1 putative lipoprotein (DUF799 domain) [Campylobacter hyointestinalis subsp. lawsonii CCUG 27631]
MKNKIQIIFLTFIVIFFSACVKNTNVDYSAHIQSNPKSMLLILSDNLSSEANIENSILARSITPLTEAGYYVMPLDVVDQFLEANGYHSHSDIKDIPMDRLYEIFGADSVMYIKALNFGTNYNLVTSQTVVHLSAELYDLKTQELLWSKELPFIEQTEVGRDPISLLVNLITTAVTQVVNTQTNRAKEVLLPIATQSIFYRYDCNDCLLRGEYSPYFRQDAQIKDIVKNK